MSHRLHRFAGRLRSSAGAPVSPAFRAPIPTLEPLIPGTEPLGRAAWLAWLRWGTVGGLVFGALFWATHDVLPIVFASAVVAYLLDRPVRWLEKRGLSRDRAFALLVAMAATVVIVILTVVAPSVFDQVNALSGRLKPAIAGLDGQIRPLAAQFEAKTGIHVPVNFDDVMGAATNFVQVPDTQATLKAWGTAAFGSGLALIGAMVKLALLPLFSFYLVSDWPKILVGAESLVPPRHRPLVEEVFGEIHRRIQGFVEGQLTLCVILGVLYSIGLSIAGIDLAVTVGMGAGVLFIVPYLGLIVGVILSATLSIVKFGVDWHLLACLGTFGAVSLLEGSFLTPQIVGHRVGLHPLVVMVAVVSGASLLGIWGVLLAVPSTAALSVVAGALLRAYKESRFYGGKIG